MLLPDSMELRVCVPFNSRSTAWASFDGRGRIELKRKIAQTPYWCLLADPVDRGRPHHHQGFEVSIPDSVCEQTVYGLVLRHL